MRPQDQRETHHLPQRNSFYLNFQGIFEVTVSSSPRAQRNNFDAARLMRGEYGGGGSFSGRSFREVLGCLLSSRSSRKAREGARLRRLRYRHIRRIVVIRARRMVPHTTPAMIAALGRFDGPGVADALAVEDTVLSESIRCN